MHDWRIENFIWRNSKRILIHWVTIAHVEFERVACESNRLLWASSRSTSTTSSATLSASTSTTATPITTASTSWLWSLGTWLKLAFFALIALGPHHHSGKWINRSCLLLWRRAFALLRLSSGLGLSLSFLWIWRGDLSSLRTILFLLRLWSCLLLLLLLLLLLRFRLSSCGLLLLLVLVIIFFVSIAVPIFTAFFLLKIAVHLDCSSNAPKILFNNYKLLIES